MRLALFSDIHGNLTALDAVLADIQAQGGVDQYWILGDLVAIGPSPVAVLDRIHTLGNTRCIRGNTDPYPCTDKRPPPTAEDVRENPARLTQFAEVTHGFGWTQGAITQGGYFDWLAALPLTIAETLPDSTRILACHASPYADDGIGFRRDLSPEQLDVVLGNADADLFFGGHHHLTLDIEVNGRRVDYDVEEVIQEMTRVHCPATAFASRFLRGERQPMVEESLPQALEQLKAEIADRAPKGAAPRAKET